MDENTYSNPLSLLQSIPTAAPSLSRIAEPLRGLSSLATNLYWTWHPEVQDLFRRLDEKLWDAGAGPVRVLRAARSLPSDPAFTAEADRALTAFDHYMQAQPARRVEGGPITYFCAEFAFHQTLNQYAGGLGILAGDHCKEASDMSLPFVAVGLFYRRGFFRQMVDWEGRQEHLYPVYEPEESSLARVLRPGTNEPLSVSVEMPGRTVHAAVWLAAVGRVPLLLLDTDLPENALADRPITSQLYTNGRDMRLHQEMVLGAGGVRALRALGIAPSAWHLNEGHSAFLLLERLRERMAQGESAEAARDAVRADSIITIHTPVPEGNERFGADHVGSLVAPLLEGSGLSAPEVLALGLGEDADPKVFDMTAFALRHTRAANGVSLLHGRTADATWRRISGYPVIGVTNGVHMPTWVGPSMQTVYASCGANFAAGMDVQTTPASGRRPLWDSVRQASDRALWEAHLAQKRALIAFAKGRLFTQHARHGEGPGELQALVDALNPDALLIGFARRFATYKRASLLFSDEDRLQRLLSDSKRPVQILFAGKAHPSDRGGQALIEEVYRKTQSAPYRGKVFLLEDYDVAAGRHLVQGSDIWLNNPRRPLEASGTSGMKAAANGVPNVSILDGWWDEAYEDGPHRNGWAIGGRETVNDPAEQDRRDALALYATLEDEVIPAFFDRDTSGLPASWLPVMKEAIATSLYAFSTRRMLEDYLKHMLLPC